MALSGMVTVEADASRTMPSSPNAEVESATVWHGSTITFENRSGETALVKVVGPRRIVVSVPTGASRTVKVGSGKHHILVRYGEHPDSYVYTKGNPFPVEDNRHRVSRITINLEKTVHGNHGSRPSSREEFERADSLRE